MLGTKPHTVIISKTRIDIDLSALLSIDPPVTSEKHSPSRSNPAVVP